MAVSQTAMFEAVETVSPSRSDRLARLDALANLMDSALLVPGTRIRIGLDSVIGLVPGIGDLASALISSYIIWEARQLGLPRWKIARMAANVALDTTVGAIPVVGDVLDVFYKSNRRNLKILRDHLAREGRNRVGGDEVIEADYTVVRRGR
ncbi:DUF4112 domain-containing protein [Enterovirga aerilata]|uniref:DUF4112 domain-containing protein n=1 Tax=Enterovirga aerilata TaxID=2730920 RepID=A0A849I2N0_9HYPH|nr:DUF4112 domain-containing protein [Enterovirga sp. DB1703]NNM73642.1 DUF4112 domain-containing protein [Enterovirga sp. DB1703]